MTFRRSFQDWSGRTEDLSFYGEYISFVAYGADGNRSEEHVFDWSLLHQRSSPVDYRSGSTWRGSASETFRPPWALFGSPDNKASAGLYNKLIQSSFNAGVFAGEFRETVGFVAQSVRKVARSLPLIRRGRFSEAARVLMGHDGSVSSTLANNWLTYQYALMPLLRDIKAAYDLMTKRYQVISRVRSKANADPIWVKTTQSGVAWSWSGYNLSEIRGVVDFEVSQADRLGLTDPLSIAWELKRLSFVIDWLIPVGNFLAAVNARNKVRFASNSLWITQAEKQSFTGPRSTSDGVILSPQAKEDFAHYAQGHRFGLSSLPVRLPTIENPLGLAYGNYVSAVALLRQAVGR